ncbi:GntR family transcriptional regulator [Mesorhizobium argentiipisi]|uniref:GntR family transcriptional regulator n=1 Tax=Mesorhizobium argentiipisi TaxID=3015175 RepID=A0ABU8KCF0_9HYPH
MARAGRQIATGSENGKRPSAAKRGLAGGGGTITDPKPASQTDEAVNRIRSLIIDMSLEPGSRIDEALLIKDFKLGRTPAREAINRLLAEGLVYIVPNRGGTFVRKLDFPEISQVIVAYQAAESICAQLCRFEDPTLVEDLKSIQDRYMKEVRKHAYLAITQINEEFHLRIHSSIGNALLFEFAKSVHRHVRRLLILIYRMEEAEGSVLDRQFDINLNEHTDIISAIGRHDRAALAAIMPVHARQVQKRMLRLLEASAVEPMHLMLDMEMPFSPGSALLAALQAARSK